MFCKDLNQIKQVFRLAYIQAELMLKNGKQVDIEVTEHKNKRSIEQNNYYFLFCSELAKFFNDAGLSYGEFQIPYTTDLIHDINKKIFGVKTTTRLSIKDFCEYMTKVLIFWTEKTHGEFQMKELAESYLQRKGYMELVR